MTNIRTIDLNHEKRPIVPGEIVTTGSTGGVYLGLGDFRDHAVFASSRTPRSRSNLRIGSAQRPRTTGKLQRFNPQCFLSDRRIETNS